LFADDLKIFTEINSIDDCSILQDDLNVLDNWCKLWQLRLNPEKCQVFTGTRKKNKISFNYKLINSTLSTTSNIKDLGINFDENLKFNRHIQIAINKALKKLGLIKRVTKDFKTLDSLIILYNTLVRPTLEYGSIIWNPYGVTLQEKLESVQKKLIKYICYKTRVPYHREDYIMLCHKYKLQTLIERRCKLDFVFLHKLVHKNIECNDLLEDIVPNIPTRNLRTSKLFKIPFLTSTRPAMYPILRTLDQCNKLQVSPYLPKKEFEEEMRKHVNKL